MILQALVEHYQRLSADSTSDVPPFGYTKQLVSFAVVITPEGRLWAIERLQVPDSQKPQPLRLTVPGYDKPSGQVTAKSVHKKTRFLCNDPMYMLGWAPDHNDQNIVRLAFEAFRNRHVSAKPEIADESFDLVCQFLTAWDPNELSGRRDIEALGDARLGVFQIRGRSEYVHKRAAVQQYWSRVVSNETDEDDENSESSENSSIMRCQCLVTGGIDVAARIHRPKIKGVLSSKQASGLLLVSFNEDAYCSHGKSKSYNAPVSEAAAFEYATGLNALLADRDHRVQLGDTTCVFWTQRPTVAETALRATLGEMDNDFWAGATEGEAADDEARTRGRVRDFFHRLRAGLNADTDALGEADVPFYVLGLSPNASRVSVRFWHVSTVSEMAQRLARHIQALEMVGRGDDLPPLTVHELLDQVVPLRNNKPDRDKIPPQLSGEVARTIITGGPYPSALMLAVNRRIRADRTINHSRAAILKAWLTRNTASNSNHKEIPVALDPDRTDHPYLLGRLFAAIEKTQLDSAMPSKLNRTVKDSYMTAASATPSFVFSRLLSLHQHHVEKLSDSSEEARQKRCRTKSYYQRLVREIMSGLSSWPNHLSLEEQGVFFIGYYHQTQDFYTRKDAGTDATPNPETTND